MRLLLCYCLLSFVGFGVFQSPAVGSDNQNTLGFVDANGNPLADVVIYRDVKQDSVAGEGSRERSEESQLHLMDQVDKQFFPQLLVIQSGDRVAFPNSDDIRHHVYSFSEPRQFELRLYSAGELPEVDFPRSGIVVVGCNIHDQMIGHILILESNEFFKSDSNGVSQVPAQMDGWLVWHPWMVEANQSPVPLESIVANQSNGSVNLGIESPDREAESELESRFNRAFNRGTNGDSHRRH